jgi:hypothetical protein
MAVKYDHLDIVKWLRDNRTEECTKTDTISSDVSKIMAGKI